MQGRGVAQCRNTCLIFRPPKINTKAFLLPCRSQGGDGISPVSTLFQLLPLIPSTSRETSTRSVGCICPAWSLTAEFIECPVYESPLWYLTRDRESTHGSYSGSEGTFRELHRQWLAATVLCGFPRMDAMSQPTPSKKGKEIGPGDVSNCLFLRTRETSTSSVGCVCPAWRLRGELIEHSNRQGRAEELAILKEEAWPKVHPPPPPRHFQGNKRKE